MIAEILSQHPAWCREIWGRWPGGFLKLSPALVHDLRKVTFFLDLSLMIHNREGT